MPFSVRKCLAAAARTFISDMSDMSYQYQGEEWEVSLRPVVGWVGCAPG